MDTKKQTPMPPIPPSTKMSKSIQFWGAIVNALDKQFEFMEENNCYGNISLEFKFKNGRVIDKITTVSMWDKVNGEPKD